MATYSLGASDLITLLNSTVTQATGRAILESIESAFSSAFPFNNTSVATALGPDDTTSGHVPAVAATIAAGTQLALVTINGSTTLSGSLFTPGAVGNQSVGSIVSFQTSGGVVVGTGDQAVTLNDSNTGAKADTVVGGASLEKLVSTGAADVLVGGSGLNTLIGGSGSDTLIGGGDSRLQAGGGAQTLKSSTLTTGSDTLLGAGGSDLLVSQGGNNRLIAGTGLNTLDGGAGSDTLFGGGKTDIVLGSGASRVNEQLSGTSLASANDTINAGSGADTIDLVMGTKFLADSIVGSTGALRIVDLAGTNTILGGAGADTIVLGVTSSAGTQQNIANQTITAGTGGIRLLTADSNYAISTPSTGVYTVSFADTGQTLTINDSTGNSVTLVFDNGGHSPVKV